jgi:hypothetical protein
MASTFIVPDPLKSAQQRLSPSGASLGQGGYSRRHHNPLCCNDDRLSVK